MDKPKNAEVMRHYVGARERNDSETAMELWADDIVHHVPGRSPLAGDFSGKSIFLVHYGKVLAELGAPSRWSRYATCWLAKSTPSP